MEIKTYIYIFLLLFYGIMHLVRVFDGVYKGTSFLEQGSLWVTERFTIPIFSLTFVFGNLISLQEKKPPALDWLIKQDYYVPLLFLSLIIINFIVLRNYPVKWERNLCISIPTIIVIMMFLGYYGVW